MAKEGGEGDHTKSSHQRKILPHSSSIKCSKGARARACGGGSI